MRMNPFQLHFLHIGLCNSSTEGNRSPQRNPSTDFLLHREWSDRESFFLLQVPVQTLAMRKESSSIAITTRVYLMYSWHNNNDPLANMHYKYALHGILKAGWNPVMGARNPESGRGQLSPSGMIEIALTPRSIFIYIGIWGKRMQILRMRSIWCFRHFNSAHGHHANLRRLKFEYFQQSSDMHFIRKTDSIRLPLLLL